MYKPLNDFLDKVEGRPIGSSTDAINAERRRQGMPEFGKTYALTGGPKEKAISNGNTWAESEVKKCPGCDRPMGKYPALSRYGHGDICGQGTDNCGLREALEGDFIKVRA